MNETGCSKQCGGGFRTLTRGVISGTNCDGRQDTVRSVVIILTASITRSNPGDD